MVQVIKLKTGIKYARGDTIMILIKNADVYTPEHIGISDVLIAGRKIAYVSKNISLPSGNFPEIEIMDASGLILTPGLVDHHVHIAGGGGEGGYATRTPRLSLTDLTLNGITTCIGLMGTDGTTRSMADLLACARALETEGITTYCWSGSYEYPTRTLTGNPRGDIILIDKIIGIGELAISDHRGSHPADHDLTWIASEARVGGLLSGKCGVLQLHLGDSRGGLDPIISLHQNSDIPFENILPTHVNRNSRLFQQSVEYVSMGGYIDITTGIVPDNDDVVHPVDAYKQLLDKGVDTSHITMSSDAGGSMPIFDNQGHLVRLEVGSTDTNLKIIRGCVENGIPLETALVPLTSSPARLLKLPSKGHVEKDLDADLLLLDKDLQIHSVYAMGRAMVRDYKAVIKGMFEK